MPKPVFTPIIVRLPGLSIGNVFFVDLEARKHEEDRIKEMFGLKANIDYTWHGDDIVIMSKTGHNTVKETFDHIQAICRFNKIPKDKTLFGHKIID